MEIKFNYKTFINEEQLMPKVTTPMHKDGDFFVDYEEKLFEDVQAEEGEKALVTFHTVAFEGSIGLVTEGGKVYACRFALQALYGHGEPSLIEGITPISPLDVLDIKLLHTRDNAFIIDTWTV